MATNLTLAFLLFFLALCANYNCKIQLAEFDLDSCVPCDCQAVKQQTVDQAQPTISSSSPFQNASIDLILQCNPAPGCDVYSSELIISHDGAVVYNSTIKRENDVTRINATAIRFPSQNLHLSNLTCAYNNSFSSNSLDIPYLNIDEFHLSSSKLEFNQTSTISCKVALKQNPDNYTVRFLFNQATHFEFKHSNGGLFWFNLANSKFQSKIKLKRAGHLVVSEYPVYSVIFAIEVKPIWKDNYGYGYKSDISYLLSTIQCELQYGNNDELMTVRSMEYSMSF